MNIMQGQKVLLLGATSFVASGLAEKLSAEGCGVQLFSRGEIRRENNYLYGSYTSLCKNNFFDNEYDIVINFAVLKNQSSEENVKYAAELCEFCKMHKVKKLLHFSSIMVYDYHLQHADENSEIEDLSATHKKGYGEIKIAVDQYLIRNKESFPFELVLIRPGYVLADNRPCPFIKRLFSKVFVIKGNKRSRQPIVRREDIHKAVSSILKKEENLGVYHFFPNDKQTKYRYAKQTTQGVVLCMPKWLFCGVPMLMTKLRIMPLSLFSRFDGMYIETDFTSQATQEYLNVVFE